MAVIEKALLIERILTYKLIYGRYMHEQASRMDCMGQYSLEHHFDGIKGGEFVCGVQCCSH
jgi:hypothetical protein